MSANPLTLRWLARRMMPTRGRTRGASLIEDMRLAASVRRRNTVALNESSNAYALAIAVQNRVTILPILDEGIGSKMAARRIAEVTGAPRPVARRLAALDPALVRSMVDEPAALKSLAEAASARVTATQAALVTAARLGACLPDFVPEDHA